MNNLDHWRDPERPVAWAKMVLHSKPAPHPTHGVQDDIATMLLRYPRCIHAELMTHRVFSRNASSSRAIPVAKLIEIAENDPFVPKFWGRNQPGMQAGADHDEPVFVGAEWVGPGAPEDCTREEAWLEARDSAVHAARAFSEAGYHKQIVNRLLEPFTWINVLVTSTQWSNFLALRDHQDAEPHMRELARAVRTCLEESVPQELEYDQWHLPFIQVHRDGTRGPIRYHDGNPDEWLTPYDAVEMSVARCARTSYLTHEGKKPTREEDLRLCAKLLGSTPLHASPAEHQAKPDYLVGFDLRGDAGSNVYHKRRWHRPDLHGNFTGWIQYRKTLIRECQ